jgi:hypothetical protein
MSDRVPEGTTSMANIEASIEASDGTDGRRDFSEQSGPLSRVKGSVVNLLNDSVYLDIHAPWVWWPVNNHPLG